MKPVLIIPSLILSLTGFSQRMMTTREEYELKGPVKSVVETSFHAKEKSGTLVKDEKMMSNEMEFDKSGKLISDKNIDYDEDETTVITTAIIYDGNSRLTGANMYQGKKELYQTVKFAYNPQGQLVSRTVHNDSGDQTEKTDYVYNNKGQLISETYYGWNGQKALTINREYEPGGKEKKETQTRIEQKKERVSSKTWTYNASGQIIKREEINSRGERTTFSVEYDQAGNVIREYADDKNYNTYVYKYDLKNNWIRRDVVMAFGQTKTESIDERTIKYY